MVYIFNESYPENSYLIFRVGKNKIGMQDEKVNFEGPA